MAAGLAVGGWRLAVVYGRWRVASAGGVVMAARAVTRMAVVMAAAAAAMALLLLLLLLLLLALHILQSTKQQSIKATKQPPNGCADW